MLDKESVRENVIKRLEAKLIPKEDCDQYEDDVWNCAVQDCIEAVERMDDE